MEQDLILWEFQLPAEILFFQISMKQLLGRNFSLYLRFTLVYVKEDSLSCLIYLAPYLSVVI